MLASVKRRRFLQSLAATSAGLPLVASSAARADETASASKLQTVRGGFALDENRVRFFSKAVMLPFKVMVTAGRICWACARVTFIGLRWTY